jgi:endonuclease/exonuclease/phosphatase family metal-dependent hydrolase
MFRYIAFLSLLLGSSGLAEARELKLVTWNLGWHLSRAEAASWIQKCGAPFRRNNATGLWEPAATGTPGWQLEWKRDAPIVWDIAQWPPCNVYEASFEVVPVTVAAYDKRLDQIKALIAGTLMPDIIAFQEVSGEQAVRDVLPNAGADYYVCSFSDYKVQRLAFAWKKELGPAKECSVEKPLSLPSLPAKDQVRPGLSLELEVDAGKFRVLNVHLKSSCVTPVEASGDNGRGALAGNDQACKILQQQIVPLERWIETKSADTARFVILGDFNRSLWHELHASATIRTDGSDPSGPLPATAKVRSLIGEVNDGTPNSSKLALLKEVCPINQAAKAACEKAENPGSVDEWRDATKTLAAVEALGCRNPVGLDHILIATGLSAPGEAQKIALGRQGRTLPADATHPNALLALSDHCPLLATIQY